MKKIFTSLCLFLAISSVFAQFVPDPNKFYNIIESTVGNVAGPLSVGSTQPALMTKNNSESQAFQFVSTGAANTYYLKNKAGMYLNKKSSGWDADWSTIFETTTNGANSEWVLEGADALNVRLKNPLRFYLAPNDTATASGSTLYCDKSATSPTGLFKLVEATIDYTPTFSVNKTVVIEIEKAKKAYPIWISAAYQTYDIIATPSAGFSVDKSTFIPADFTSNGGKSSFNVQETTANIGDSGKVVFSYTSGGVIQKLDSIAITVVTPYERKVIKNNASTYGISASTTDAALPLLDALVHNNPSQQFFFRPVNKGVNDSLYYIIQDVDYKSLQKNPANGWDTKFGVLENVLSVWKIMPTTNGTNRIKNIAANGDLGVDAITQFANIYDNKTYLADGSTPKNEWAFLTVPTDPSLGLDDADAVTSKVYAYVSNHTIYVHGTVAGDAVKVYNISGQLVKELTANSEITSINLKSGLYLIKVNANVLKVIN